MPATCLASLTDQDPAELIARCKSGLSIAIFDETAKCLGLSNARLADIIHIPKTTLARRKHEGKLTFDESERLYRIVRLYQMAVDLLGTPDIAREWLNAPIRNFENNTPLELADNDIGAREVEAMLDRIADGVIF